MKPDQIECIDQLITAWVVGVVGVQEQIPIVDDGTTRCLASCVCIPARRGRLLIHAGDKHFHRLSNTVCPAECTDHAPFCCGILLLRQPPAFDCFGPGNLRPLADIPPVTIHIQQAVHAAERVIVYLA